MRPPGGAHLDGVGGDADACDDRVGRRGGPGGPAINRDPSPYPRGEDVGTCGLENNAATGATSAEVLGALDSHSDDMNPWLPWVTHFVLEKSLLSLRSDRRLCDRPPDLPLTWDWD